MKNKVLVTMILLIAMAGTMILTGCGKKDGPTVLVVATEPTFPPFEMTDENTGEITGFDIELINAIAAAEGLQIQVNALGFDGLIPALQSGNIDIAASGITITDDREKMVDFTEPYIEAGLALAIADDNNNIKGVADLVGKKAAVQIGTSGAGKADELKAAGQLADIKTFDTVAVAVQELINGGVDVLINDLPVTQAFMQKQPGKIKLAGPALNSESYGFAVRDGRSDLLQKLNDGLKKVKENGTYDEIYKKYF